MSETLSRLLSTTLALLEQFQIAVVAPSSPPALQTTGTQNNISNAELGDKNNQKNVLPLLSTCSTALRSQVTKLSLLTINSPFTPSAINTVLTPVNDSVLPSLVSAFLLVTPDRYTSHFHTETQTLTRAVLRELAALVREVKVVADRHNQIRNERKKKNIFESEQPSSERKDAVVVATGRVWDACDALLGLAGKGVIGFIIHRVEQWRDLVKDAISELEEWDPSAEDANDDDFLDSDGDGDDGGISDPELLAGEKQEERRDAEEGKKTLLRALKPIAQIYPAVISQRLKPINKAARIIPDLGTLNSDIIPDLETLLKNLHLITDSVDEAAASLYESDLQAAIRHVGDAKDYAAAAVASLVSSPFQSSSCSPSSSLLLEPDGDGQGGNEHKGKEKDKFVIWRETWTKVMDRVMSDVDGILSSSSGSLVTN